MVRLFKGQISQRYRHAFTIYDGFFILRWGLGCRASTLSLKPGGDRSRLLSLTGESDQFEATPLSSYHRTTSNGYKILACRVECPHRFSHLLHIMPSEPLEAEFAFPPALSRAQEDEFRALELEGPLPLSPHSTRPSTIVGSPNVHDLEQKFKDQGIRLVTFEKGTGEDPREWSYGKKWCVCCFFCHYLRLTVEYSGISLVRHPSCV